MDTSITIKVFIAVLIGIIMSLSPTVSMGLALTQQKLGMDRHTPDSIVIKNNTVTFGNGSVISGNKSIKSGGEIIFRESCSAHKIEVTLPDGTTVCGWEDECLGMSYPVAC